MNEEILKRIDLLATKLGVTANQIITILRNQVKIEIVLDIIYLIGSIGILLGWFFIVPLIKKLADDYDEIPFVIGIGYFILSMVAVCFIVGISLDLPTLLINPDYWVLNKIIEGVKK